MRDRQQRPQRPVGVTASGNLMGELHECLGRTRLKPHIAADHLVQPREACGRAPVEVGRADLIEQPAGVVYEPQVVRGLGSCQQPFALPPRLDAQCGGALEGGTGDCHRATTYGCSRMTFQIHRDRFVAARFRHCAVPELALTIVDDRGKRAVHGEHLERRSRLAHG